MNKELFNFEKKAQVRIDNIFILNTSSSKMTVVNNSVYPLSLKMLGFINSYSKVILVVLFASILKMVASNIFFKYPA